MKKYSKKWLLKYEPYIVCENIHTRLLVSVILDRMGFNAKGAMDSFVIAIYAKGTFTFAHNQHSSVASITAADFITANPGRGGARPNSGFKNPNPKTATITIRVTPDDKAKIVEHGGLVKVVEWALKNISK